MARRILFIAVALILAGFLYVGYSSYDAGRAVTSGEVYSNDPSSGKTKSAETESPEARTPSPSDIVYPPANQPTASATPVGQTSTPGSGIGTAAIPATDSISPNPPNGMVFAGTGKYQLYRQGNITWRLDTETGHTCIIFATEEEWKKPKILRAGCGKT